MEAYLLIKFESGVGDTYSTLVSAYEASLELEKFGYNTTLVLETRRNVYFSPEIKLDVLYDLSGFKNVLYNLRTDITGNPDILGLFNARRLPQQQVSYHIYLDELIPELQDYQSCIFGHPELKHNSRRPVCNTALLSPKVLKIAKTMLPDTSRVVGLQYRAYDMQGDIEHLLDPIRSTVDKYAEVYKDRTVLVSSNGNFLRNYMKTRHSNVLSPTFSNNTIPFYPCYVKHREDLTEEDFVLHAQEIAAEMSLYMYCEKIISFSPFLSNFITYGIINNQYTKNYTELILEGV